MKAVQAEYQDELKKITIRKNAKVEDWVMVCKKFNDDVERVCDVTDLEDYTGLYQCFDDKNKGFYYLVTEDKLLYRLKHKHFMNNIGID